MTDLVSAIDHIQLVMPAGGEDDARRFFSGVLGIPEATRPPSFAGSGGVWFENPGVKIHVGVDPEFRPARRAHPALVVTNLDAALAACRKNDVAIAEAEKTIPGIRRAFVSDPFGNRIELLERMS